MNDRYRDDEHGRYLARDKSLSPVVCEHATWEAGRVVWVEHPQGGTMRPFTGPDDVWEQLILDADQSLAGAAAV